MESKKQAMKNPLGLNSYHRDIFRSAFAMEYNGIQRHTLLTSAHIRFDNFVETFCTQGVLNAAILIKLKMQIYIGY